MAANVGKEKKQNSTQFKFDQYWSYQTEKSILTCKHSEITRLKFLAFCPVSRSQSGKKLEFFVSYFHQVFTLIMISLSSMTIYLLIKCEVGSWSICMVIPDREIKFLALKQEWNKQTIVSSFLPTEYSLFEDILTYALNELNVRTIPEILWKWNLPTEFDNLPSLLETWTTTTEI